MKVAGCTALCPLRTEHIALGMCL